jgi:hypothetical protein
MSFLISEVILLSGWFRLPASSRVLVAVNLVGTKSRRF